MIITRTNARKKVDIRTAEGAKAAQTTKVQALRRSVMSCMLWEDEFYEDGETVATRIQSLAAEVNPETLAAIAIEARHEMHLRHVPLLLLTMLCKTGSGTSLVSETIEKVISRADELSELLSVYWKINGKDKPLSKQLKLGLARAFNKFDEYRLAKYNRDGEIKLRDVMFLVHPKPKDEELAKRVAENQLATPDTWEVELSSGKNKAAVFERLIKEEKLGYLALLRNLRNMKDVPRKIVTKAILARKGAGRVLPFRFIAAAKAAPDFEPMLDTAMLAHLANVPKLPGRTLLVVDVSGSMYGAGNISKYSDMTRIHAACALAAILRETADDPIIYATAGYDSRRIHETKLVPARRGLALVDAIHGMCHPLGGGGIFLTQVCEYLRKEGLKDIDNMIVITDEQDCDTITSPLKAKPLGKRNYLINIASAKNGIGYKPNWTHIDGWSEHVLRYINHDAQTAN